MANIISICNLALSHLGDRANVSNLSPTDRSAQADHCGMFYPIARDALLEMHAWRFATRSKALAEITTNKRQWGYAYAQPADCLRILAVLPDGGTELQGADYEAETKDDDGDASVVILTDEPIAFLRYIRRVDDATTFSPLFVTSLSWLLAGYLAGPVLKGDAGRKAALECQKEFFRQFAMAASSDANQRHGDPRANEAQAPWMAGR